MNKQYRHLRVIWLILLILCLSSVSGCDRPQPTAEDSDEIIASDDPVQIPYNPDNPEEPIVIEIDKGKFIIKPLAEYKAAAMVARKEFYSYGWQGKISPVDLVLVWGELAEPEYDKFVTYSQHDRWYFFENKKESPFNISFVYNHSANNHIIPANDNIYKAIKTIKKKQKVLLEGFLVNLDGIYEGQTFWWRSSLTRKDTGDGSCELFYVEKIKIDDKIYN